MISLKYTRYNTFYHILLDYKCLFTYNLYIILNEGGIYMIVNLNTKELTIIKGYVEEMLDLYEEKDMLEEDEAIYLSNEDIDIYKNELLQLNKKL